MQLFCNLTLLNLATCNALPTSSAYFGTAKNISTFTWFAMLLLRTSSNRASVLLYQLVLVSLPNRRMYLFCIQSASTCLSFQMASLWQMFEPAGRLVYLRVCLFAYSHRLLHQHITCGEMGRMGLRAHADCENSPFLTTLASLHRRGSIDTSVLCQNLSL